VNPLSVQLPLLPGSLRSPCSSLVGEELRDLEPVFARAGFFSGHRPQSLLLAIPLRAVLEQMLSCLGLVVVPPALGVWPSRGLLQVLSREAVARLELVGPRSELLIRSIHGSLRLLLVARPVFAVACSGELCLDPPAGVCPLGLRALAFDVGEGAGWCALPSGAVHVSVPFHAAGVRFVGDLLGPLVGGLLGPLVGFLVASDPRSGWGTTALRPGSLAPCGGVRRCVSLPRWRIAVLGQGRPNPPYGRLSVNMVR